MGGAARIKDIQTLRAEVVYPDHDAAAVLHEIASGIIVWWAHSWITSYRSQIEIIRKYRLKIRVSPSRRDQFLEYAHKALADWKRTHPA